MYEMTSLMFEKFLKRYLTLGIGFSVLMSGLFEAVLSFPVDHFEITESELIPSGGESPVADTMGTLIAVQLFGLMATGVVFVLF